MPVRSIDLTLDIAEDGAVTVRPQGAPAAAAPAPVTPAPPFDGDFSPTGKRRGYDPEWLGKGAAIPLPDLGSLAPDATILTDPAGGDPHVLRYRGYSVVMHAARRFAIYSAANVDGANRFHLRRPRDEWRFDPRIPQSAQVGGYYYADDQFDRGHLTRYEDMQYGASPTDALAAAADTLFYTNCTPQHSKFNQGLDLWAGLERDVLEQAIEARAFRAVVMTGPVLDPADPVWSRYPDVRYPLRFWKIAAALTTDGAPFAAGFVLDQSAVIDQFGIEPKAIPPFAPFKTYQVSVREIESLTGLTFGLAGGPLSAADPLADPDVRRSASARASAAIPVGAPSGYVPLTDGADMIGPRGR